MTQPVTNPMEAGRRHSSNYPAVVVAAAGDFQRQEGAEAHFHHLAAAEEEEEEVLGPAAGPAVERNIGSTRRSSGIHHTLRTDQPQ